MPAEHSRDPHGGAPRPVPARRGQALIWKGKTLLSAVDPLGQAERAVEKLPESIMEGTLFFVPSPLLCYGLEKLLSRIKKKSAVLCVEAEAELLRLSIGAFAPLAERTKTDRADSSGGTAPSGSALQESIPAGPSSPPRIVLLEAAPPEKISALVRRIWGPRRFRRVQLLRLGGGWQFAEEQYAKIFAALETDIAGNWGNALTLTRLGRRYIHNFIQNLPLLAGASPFPAGASSAPVLVTGAGPSLDAFLDGIVSRFPGYFPRTGAAEFRRPFSIFTVDTALPCLLARNIVPDMIIALESQHWNIRDFCGAADRAIPLALDMSALPGTARILSGPLFLFFTPWTELSLFTRLREAGFLPSDQAAEKAGRVPPEIPALGSVGLSAVALALRYTAGPVVTAGIDFSFFPEKYHARETPGSVENLRRANRLRSPIRGDTAFRSGNFRIQAKDGRTVTGGGALKRYRDLFTREFSPSARLFDTKSSGLDLGIPVLENESIFALLDAPESAAGPAGGPAFPSGNGAAGAAAGRDALAAFLRSETEKLREMRNILAGGDGAGENGTARLETLLDRCGFLWAHFPEAAGAEGRRPAPPVRTDGPGADNAAWLSFLKRVRAEIDPFIRRLELAIRETARDS